MRAKRNARNKNKRNVKLKTKAVVKDYSIKKNYGFEKIVN